MTERIGHGPDDLFDPKWVPEYKAQVDILHIQLNRLADRIDISRDLIEFEWQVLFPGILVSHFIHIILDSLFESIALASWRLSIDTSSDGLTLRQFKNDVMANLKDAAAREEMARRLKEGGFEDGVKVIEAKLASFRMQYFAHLDREHVLRVREGKESAPRLALDDLKGYVWSLKKYFDLLWFGPDVRRLFSQIQYQEGPNNVRYFLFALLRDSGLLDLPTRDPPRWAIVASQLTDRQKIWLDDERRRFISSSARTGLVK